ncbi:hypothetical protein BK009_00990 [Methanobacterium subterraneum]|uniref:Tyr recombinase domain-containing protein n=1 Tax=Methanobacterium subterraneum TaxID=59277 RepID=A0A2H4VMQ9_9EURY|nr:site-specific integrase [Methanobacterium subterraneum]AUB59379.1 hypothetical protein BK009_00990 [Methanobacterium subterraneum]
MKVENDPLFKDFCLVRNLASPSVKLYRLALEKYTDFTEMSLDNLITEAEDEEDTVPRLRKRKITKYLSGFKEHLNQGDLSSYYTNHQVGLVRTFYGEFDIQLPKSHWRKSRSDKKQENIEDLPTKDDIKRSLDHSKTTYRAIILLMLSSGMSRSEIASLTFKHYYDAIPLDISPKTLNELIKKVEVDNLILYWKLKRVKTGKYYFTFSSPETSDYILRYLKELYRGHPNYIPKPEDTFFRLDNHPINPDNLSQMFKRINQRAGLKRANGNLTVRPHLLRKFFSTTLERNRFPHLYTRWLMGHSVDSTTEAYFKADPEAVKEEYKQVVDHLTITQDIKFKPVTTEGYDQLLKELREKDKDYKILENRLEILEGIVQDKAVQNELNKR